MPRPASYRRSLDPVLPEPFRVGVRPLGEEPWLRVDGRLPARLDEKARLLADRPDAVRGALPGTEAAAGEAHELVVDWLAAHAVGTHEWVARPDAAEGDHEGVASGGSGTAGTVAGVPATLRVRGRDAPPPDAAPLVRAALLVSEDLALMSRIDGRWRLAALCIAFPSAWNPSAKLGLPMDEVHAPVPGFGPGTRQAALIGRMFDRLRPGCPVRRGNWSLHADATLHLPQHAPGHERRLADRPLESLWLRRERQTLSRLVRSGDILFTIDTTLEPVASLGRDARAALDAQLAALAPAERRYRSLAGLRDPAR